MPVARRDLRERAASVLWRADRSARFVDEVLEDAYPRGLSEGARSLLAELVYGTVRWRGLLDAILEHYASGKRLRPKLRWILRLALYQLGFLRQVAPSVAVHAAVAHARRLFGSGGGKLANAVLRRVLEEWERRPRPAAGPDPRRDVETAPEEVWRGPESFFPDPEQDPVGNAALRFSMPRWLVERWARNYPRRWEALVRAQAERPRIHCWVHPARGVSAARAALAVEGVRAEVTPWGLRIAGETSRLLRSRPFREGWLLIQDETAAGVVPFLSPQTGERILEVGAAPGGKTVALLAAVGETGVVVALDRARRRLARARENLARCGGLERARLLTGDARVMPLRPEARFDRVLVDAPCSNTGVLARRPDARWRLRPEDLAVLQRLQREMLRGAAAHVRPGGVLVYSTCSLEPEENQEVVRGLGPGWQVEGEEVVFPDGLRDGGYRARLRAPGEPSLGGAASG